MKKYIVIVNGKVEVDSSALDRAKQYAVEALRGLPDGAQAAIYSHCTTAVQRDVIWKSTPNGEAVAPKEKKATRKGIICKPWATAEDQEILAWMVKFPDATGSWLAETIHKSNRLPDRTLRAIEMRISKLRNEQ